jgi:hypothetical protein
MRAVSVLSVVVILLACCCGNDLAAQVTSSSHSAGSNDHLVVLERSLTPRAANASSQSDSSSSNEVRHDFVIPFIGLSSPYGYEFAIMVFLLAILGLLLVMLILAMGLLAFAGVQVALKQRKEQMYKRKKLQVKSLIDQAFAVFASGRGTGHIQTPLPLVTLNPDLVVEQVAGSLDVLDVGDGDTNAITPFGLPPTKLM